MADEESAKNPFFKKVLDSQREYASKVVPAKRFMFPPYSFAANYYLPEDKKPAAAKAAPSRSKLGGDRALRQGRRHATRPFSFPLTACRLTRVGCLSPSETTTEEEG